MDSKLLKKINDLAASLKQNRLAADMDEAVDMAKRMLTKDPAGNDTVATVAEMGADLKEEGKELKKLSGESGALVMDAQMAHERQTKNSEEAHQHSEEFKDLKKDIEQTDEELEALKSIKKDAPIDAKKEEEAYKSEEAAKEDLPGEEHQ